MATINQDNRARWNALARANVEYSRPFLDFTRKQAAEYIYRHGVLNSSPDCQWINKLVG